MWSVGWGCSHDNDCLYIKSTAYEARYAKFNGLPRNFDAKDAHIFQSIKC